MEQATLYDLNFRVLRLHHPKITSILARSPYVVLYSFSDTEKTWVTEQLDLPFGLSRQTKEHCEGTLNNGYGYTILNRLSLESFSADLVCPDDLEYSDPYVIHRLHNGIAPAAHGLRHLYIRQNLRPLDLGRN
ncbi:unnamed protein product [Pneumocystis jirovecii]|uniref:Uncharacterized protein n=1 Tax=Pneumocystis jirovecii TaxID=42068 RepID=L0PBZ5_PNEJI|nr:unnamed protein product [Pneumocystis jirovecii]